MMISAAQLRAARGLLDWTRTELAEAAKISPETIKNIEHGIFRPQEETAGRIVKAFTERGVIFTDSDGVKKTSNSITIYEGHEGFKKVMDSIYETALMPCSLNGEKPIAVCNVDNNLFKKYLKDYAVTHVERMSKIEGLKIRIVATKKESASQTVGKYLQYKYMEEKKSLPFYVFGDKFAIINFDDEENPPKIIVINSAPVAQAYRNQFDILWETALSAAPIAHKE